MNKLVCPCMLHERMNELHSLIIKCVMTHFPPLMDVCLPCAFRSLIARLAFGHALVFHVIGVETEVWGAMIAVSKQCNATMY